MKLFSILDFNNYNFLYISYSADNLNIINPKGYAFKGIEILMPQKFQNSKQTYITHEDFQGNKNFAGHTKI